MTRRATAESLMLPFPPASTERIATCPFVFRWRQHPWSEPVVVTVPRRHEDHGVWPHGVPAMVPADHGAVERAMQRRAERVAEELRGGKRARRTMDATSIRELLLKHGALDHHEIAQALDGSPVDAAHVLTHLRNSGHVHRADTRKRPRTTPGDVGGPRTMGVWELTAQGRAAMKRQQKSGGKLSTYNDSGYRSSGRTP